MTQFFKQFQRREDGAVTVDWVVLTALTVTLFAGGYSAMSASTATVSTSTAEYMSTYDPN